MKTPFLLVLAGLSFAAVQAASETENPRFAALDTDRDGRISRLEFKTSVQQKQGWWRRGEATAKTDQNAATPEVFTALDRDRDNFISAEEWRAGEPLLRSRSDNGEGASRTRNVTPPGDPQRSQKSESAVEKSER